MSEAFHETVLKFAEKYSISVASQRFKIPISTIKRWMKLHHVPVRPKFNSPGQGRKISYSKETDLAIAEHVRELLARQERISTQELCNYARQLVLPENPQFNASTGWAQRFLIRHKLDLGHQRTKREATQKSEGRVSDNRGRPLSYSNETDQTIAAYVRHRQEESQMVTNSELRKFARELILKENPNFTGSASWAQNFLLRHKLNLHATLQDKDTPTSSSSSPSSVPHLTTPQEPMASDTPLNPPAEITHTSVSHSDLTTTLPSSLNIAAISGSFEPDSTSEDPMKAAMALLSSENLDSALVSQAQAAALQSTLGELTSDQISLVDLLNNAQQLQQQSGADPVSLMPHHLDSSASGALFLGLPTSEAFSSGLTGAAATQVNPNTQAPAIPPTPSPTGGRPETETGQASRPLSYTKETDLALAKWVQEQQAAGKKVTFASLRAYAKKLVSLENPNFNASVGWVTPFLLRHNLDLSVNKKMKRDSHKPNPAGKGEPLEGDEEREEELEGMGEAAAAAAAMQTEGSRAKGCSQPEAGAAETLQPQAAPLEITLMSMAATQLVPPQLQVANAQLQEEGCSILTSESQLPVGTTLPHHPPPHDPQLEIHPSAIEGAAAGAKQLLAPAETPEKFVLPARRSSSTKGQRRRHPLSEKLEVIKLMKEHNLAAHYVCRMLGIANSTLAGWVKLVQVKGAELELLSANKKRANVSGQGRPLSYSKEKDEAIARWVRSQQELGIQVTPAELTKYATSVVDAPGFTASSGWQQKFLLRHGLHLAQKASEKAAPMLEDTQSVPAAIHTEEVVTHEFSANIYEKNYADELDELLAQWVRGRLRETGSLSIEALCLHAEELIVQHNPVFVATLGWAFKFLHRHGLMLDPKPTTAVTDGSSPTPSHKRSSELAGATPTAKRLRSVPSTDVSMSPSTGNLCEALLALSQQEAAGEGMTPDQVQAAMQAVQSAVAAMQQHSEALPPVATAPGSSSSSSPPADSQGQQSSASTYFGKPAREFTQEEKEEVVRYANATTLQKAALKYGVAAPTVWRWRVELKLHQPKYTSMQKKYIIKFAETNSLKEAAQRYGITGKTIQNWRKALQAEGELPVGTGIVEEVVGPAPPEIQGEDLMETSISSTGEASSETMAYDGQNFQFIVDGGEVMDSVGGQEGGGAMGPGSRVAVVPLEVTSDMDIENVGMEYDVVSSEGHAAKPRCTLQEKKRILQYAIEHSIKEASQKFGVSQGTLYYWKKNLAAGTLEKKTAAPPSSIAPLSLSTPSTGAAAGQYSNLSDEATVIQAVNPATPEEGVAMADQFIATPTTTAASVPENVQILSQTLAALGPADINLLQAVSSLSSLSSLLANTEGEALEAAQKDGHHRKVVTVGGCIASPTDVLVTPFHTTVSSTAPTSQVSPGEEGEEEEGEVAISDSTVVVVDSVNEAGENVAVETVDEKLSQPAVAESMEVSTSPSGLLAVAGDSSAPPSLPEADRSRAQLPAVPADD